MEKDPCLYTANEMYFAACLGLTERHVPDEFSVETDDADETSTPMSELLCFPIHQSLTTKQAEEHEVRLIIK
jgi:hypothetical protein